MVISDGHEDVEDYLVVDEATCLKVWFPKGANLKMIILKNSSMVNKNKLVLVLLLLRQSSGFQSQKIMLMCGFVNSLKPSRTTFVCCEKPNML